MLDACSEGGGVRGWVIKLPVDVVSDCMRACRRFIAVIRCEGGAADSKSTLTDELHRLESQLFPPRRVSHFAKAADSRFSHVSDVNDITSL